MTRITIERETVQAALRALDYLGDSSDYDVTPFAWQAAEAGQACTALRAALAAQPADAPTMPPLSAQQDQGRDDFGQASTSL